MFIDFSPQVAIVPNDWQRLWDLSEREKLTLKDREVYEEKLLKIFHVKFVQNSEELPQKFFASNLTSFEKDGIQISLNFSDPILVS